MRIASTLVLLQNLMLGAAADGGTASADERGHPHGVR